MVQINVLMPIVLITIIMASAYPATVATTTTDFASSTNAVESTILVRIYVDSTYSSQFPINEIVEKLNMTTYTASGYNLPYTSIHDSQKSTLSINFSMMCDKNL